MTDLREIQAAITISRLTIVKPFSPGFSLPIRKSSDAQITFDSAKAVSA